MTESYINAPYITEDHLVDWGGWSLLREGRSLLRENTILDFKWDYPEVITTQIESGIKIETKVNLRSLTFVQVKCDCGRAGGARFCSHAMVACLRLKQIVDSGIVVEEKREISESRVAQQNDDIRSFAESSLKSFKESEDADCLRVRIVLPPNFKDAANRNAIMIKLELIVGREILAPERVSKNGSFSVNLNDKEGLLLIESWTGGSLHGLLQLKRSQLFQLIKALGDHPLIYESVVAGSPLTLEEIEKNVLPLLNSNTEADAVKVVTIPRRPSMNASKQFKSAVDQLKEYSWMLVDGSPHFLSIQFNSKDDPLYERARNLLKSYQFRSEPSNGKWWLRDQHRVLNFIAAESKTLNSVFNCGYSDNFKSRMSVLENVSISAETTEQNGDFKLKISISGNGLEEADIRIAVASGRSYILQEDKIWLISPDVLEKFKSATAALSGQKDRIFSPNLELKLKSSDLADSQSIIEELDGEFYFPESWRQKSEALKQVGKLCRPPVSEDFFNLLRSYQRIGVAWLFHLYESELGGILADEMGLGKTIQAIGLIQSIFNQDNKASALVVAPASLLTNWAREINRFAPELTVFINHRDQRLSKDDRIEGSVIITSYNTLRNDLELLFSHKFSTIIADEAQHIKNRRTKGARSLRQIQSYSRFILTGTPVENSIEDLRSLFSFCLPGYLKPIPDGARGEERRWFDQRILDRVAPYILRRNKKEVAPELPDKIEQIVWCDLSKPQEKLYQSVRELIEKRMNELIDSGAGENRLRFLMLTELLRLRQVCADPKLFDDEFPFEQSAKMEAFSEILEEAIDGGHRILVFSQFVQLLGHLRNWLDEKGYRYAYIDGKTKDRLAVCDKFNNDESISLCLISLKAGGTGLNLTGADTVVHFDPWWNPAVEDQATDRAHRIGQERTVTVYKLVTSGTVEEKVLALQKEKAELLREVLDASIAKTAKVNLDTLKSLIE